LHYAASPEVFAEKSNLIPANGGLLPVDGAGVIPA